MGPRHGQRSCPIAEVGVLHGGQHLRLTQHLVVERTFVRFSAASWLVDAVEDVGNRPDWAAVPGVDLGGGWVRAVLVVLLLLLLWLLVLLVVLRVLSSMKVMIISAWVAMTVISV